MKLNIELKDMNYSEHPFKTDYVETTYKEYKHTFKSGHKISIYTLANGELWMGSFTAPNDKFGEMPTRETPQEVLDYFKDLFEKNDIRPELIKGFEE